MNWRSIWAIARKDLKEVFANRAVWAPVILLPLILVVALPVLLLVLPTKLPAGQTNIPPDLVPRLMGKLPVGLAELIAPLEPTQQISLLMVSTLFAPMLLTIPLMIASLIGANSFAGEKERKTLEALLYTPATDGELLLGKMLAAVIPAVLLSWVSFALYAVVVNAASWPIVGRIWFPTPTWWPLMLWVTPAIAVLGLGLTVIVSSKVSTFMEANQLSGISVIVVVALVVSQVSGALYLGTGLIILLGAVIWALDIGLIAVAIKTFSRSSLITRM
ncbi:ABC-2 family transporter protein [compost metagenome]